MGFEQALYVVQNLGLMRVPAEAALHGGESFLIVAEAENGDWAVYDTQMWAKFESLLQEERDEDKQA